MVYAAAPISEGVAKVSAHSASTGEIVWATNASGKELWNTSSMNFSVVLASAVPVLSTDSMIVPISYEDPTCTSALEGKLSHFAELALSDGTLLGRVEAPTGMYAAEVSSPVSVGGLWVFTWAHFAGYLQKSVIIALKPPTVDSTVVV